MSVDYPFIAFPLMAVLAVALYREGASWIGDVRAWANRHDLSLAGLYVLTTQIGRQQ